MSRSDCNRFILEADATGAQLAALFRRIVEDCRAGAKCALLVCEGMLPLKPEELAAAVRSLSCGCPSGFRLACVAAMHESFENWVRAEDAGLRDGIVMRVFFDESNALHWLGLY